MVEKLSSRHFVGDAVHGVDAVADGLAGNQGRRDGGRGIAVEAEDLRWARGLGDGDELVEQDRRPSRSGDIEVAQIDGLVSRSALDLADDLVLLAVHDEVAESLFAQRELHGLCDTQGRDSLILGPLAVDGDPEFRLVELEVDIDKVEGRVGLGSGEEGRQDLLELLQVGRLDDVLDRAGRGGGRRRWSATATERSVPR